MHHTSRFVILALIAIAFSVSGCASTTTSPAKNDMNYPTLTWKVKKFLNPKEAELRGEISTIKFLGPSRPSDAQKTWQGGYIERIDQTKYDISLQAESPNGIKQITLDGGGMFNCFSPSSPQIYLDYIDTKDPISPANIQHLQKDLSPGPNGEVTTQDVLVLLSFGSSALPCTTLKDKYSRVDWVSYDSGILTLTGTATTYNGMKASSQLKLEIAKHNIIRRSRY